MQSQEDELVSVVLVNFRGANDTLTAVRALRECAWPAERLEIIVVENGSGDASLELLATEPGITIVESAENLGFAGGCNLGASHAKGEILAFLNNDARPHVHWISEAVAVLDADPGVGAVASKVLSWEGDRVDFIGAALTWYGMGYKPLTGELVPAKEPGAHDVLFATGSAMFVRRSVFERLGGFDEGYFMFFEDVDLGWRINLLGSRVRYLPTSIAYHRHHASMIGHGAHKENVLLERNALLTLFKNLEDETLRDVLPAAMALSVRRAMVEAGLDPSMFDLRRSDDGRSTIEVPKAALVPMLAIDQFTDALPAVRVARQSVQADRVRTDAALWPLFGLADAPVRQEQRYLDGYENLVAAFPVTERPNLPRVVVVTGDPFGLKLAGPAIRAWSIAKALSSTCEVTLVSLSRAESESVDGIPTIHIRAGDESSMNRVIDGVDIILFQGHALAAFDCIKRSSARIVADIYDPMHLEQLEQAKELGDAEWRRQVEDATAVMNEQLERADFFICASEKQRDFYLGQLAALGRITIDHYRNDPELRGLIDVVPFGLSDQEPVHRRDVLKGVRHGIPREAKLILWSGGLYNWFDPHTLIRAVALLRTRRPDVHLFFQGTKHPHPGVPEMEIVQSSRELARTLGVLESGVHFNDSWVPFTERENYLTEADAGVSTHRVHLETAFSFRTRILDYLWAGLPMVVTKGDHFADLIMKEELGVVVDDGDVSQLADGLERVLFDEDFASAARERILAVRARYEWRVVLEPLIRYVDRVSDVPSGEPEARRPPRVRRSGFAHDVSLALDVVRSSGGRAALRKIGGRVRRRWGLTG